MRREWFRILFEDDGNRYYQSWRQSIFLEDIQAAVKYLTKNPVRLGLSIGFMRPLEYLVYPVLAADDEELNCWVYNESYGISLTVGIKTPSNPNRDELYFGASLQISHYDGQNFISLRNNDQNLHGSDAPKKARVIYPGKLDNF
jgi:hypothetical protein